MKLTDIKKELNRLDKAKLVEIIAELYKKNKSVKEYFDFFVQPDEEILFEKYRDKVFEAFYPKRGFHLKLKDAKRAIIEFKKFEPSPRYLADLMLFYVECGVKFTLDFGDIDDKFYSSIVKMFQDVSELMYQESLVEEFTERADAVVLATIGMGWGFSDALNDIHLNYFADFRDDEESNEEPKSINTSKIIPISSK